MTQGVLPFKYKESKKSRSLTNFSGLLPYVELLYQMDFFNLVKRHVRVHGGEQGWLDGQILLSLILLNLAGGDCPEDIERLENDPDSTTDLEALYWVTAGFIVIRDGVECQRYLPGNLATQMA